jgi:hypothetical protein
MVLAGLEHVIATMPNKLANPSAVLLEFNIRAKHPTPSLRGVSGYHHIQWVISDFTWVTLPKIHPDTG